MNFNQKLDRHIGNLDNAYDALLESREQEVLEDEIIRDRILTNQFLFNRLARRWLDDPVNREGFLDWSVEEVKRERTPKYTKAWAENLLGEV